MYLSGLFLLQGGVDPNDERVKANMTSEPKKYRLLTRSDFDGLVCALLLKELNILGSIKFVHPKDVQDGKIEVAEVVVALSVAVGVAAGAFGATFGVTNAAKANG